MKKFLIFMAFIAMLCSCSSKKKEAEYWKGWVAMNTYGYSLQKDYKEQHNYHMEFSPLFSENETTAVDDYWANISWLEKDLTNLASKMYGDMIDEIISSYSSYVEDRKKSVSTDGIIAEAIDNCLTDHTGSSSDGEKYYNVYQELPDEAGKYKGRMGTVSYSIDWLVNDEDNLNKLHTNLIGFCGNYKDFYKYVMKSVSVVDIEKAGKRSGAKMYDVTYKISYGNSSGYALCRILINKKDSEIELVDKSKNLLDLTY